MADYKFDGKNLTNRSIRIGYIDGKYIRDKSGNRLGEYDGAVVRDKSGGKVAVIDRDFLDDRSGGKLISFKDLDKLIDGPGGGIKAALWWFFIR